MKMLLSVAQLLVGLLLASGCSSTAADGLAPSRPQELRKLIAKNLHFNLHCWCRAADSRTVTVVRKETGPADIPTFIVLLGDDREQVGFGAQGLLEAFGEEALIPLEEATRSGNKRAAENARQAIANVRRAMPRNATPK